MENKAKSQFVVYISFRSSLCTCIGILYTAKRVRRHSHCKRCGVPCSKKYIAVIRAHKLIIYGAFEIERVRAICLVSLQQALPDTAHRISYSHLQFVGTYHVLESHLLFVFKLYYPSSRLHIYTYTHIYNLNN